MNREALEKLLIEVEKESEYTLNDLFKIRDALDILAKYNLHDKDLLAEVNKFINDWQFYSEDANRNEKDMKPEHPDNR